METTHSLRELGPRDRRAARYRLGGLVVLVLATAVAELTLGRHFAAVDIAAQRRAAADNWAAAAFQAPPGSVPIPAKGAGVRRVLFISNSHAATGGRVARHLQQLLNEVAPESFELLDLSAPGIFAPDMLQRTLQGMAWQPDLLLLSVSYISFSDSMPLERQAHSARSFLRPDVFTRLRPGFWWRNYDIGLIGETLISSRLRLYRYRNRIRDLWERPAVRALSTAHGPTILFLDVDENQRWRFPEGYDNNLIQPRLYSAGRRGQLDDLEELVSSCARESLPVISCNLPMDWRKTLAEPDLEDFELYDRQVREVLDRGVSYVDLQPCFPVGFTTYDAMHPTWHGARLHALQLALEMQRHGFLEAAPDEIATRFDEGEAALSPAYAEAISDPFGLPPDGPARYDIFDPSEAAGLLFRVAATAVGDREETHLLYGLSRRIIFWWQELDDEAGCDGGFGPSWADALRREMTKARVRAVAFADALSKLQARRLSDYPLPSLPRAVTAGGDAEIDGHHFKLLSYSTSDGCSVVVFTTAEGRPVALRVVTGDGRGGYFRVDLLGDGSFVLFRPLHLGFVPPLWLSDRDELLRWGW